MSEVWLRIHYLVNLYNYSGPGDFLITTWVIMEKWIMMGPSSKPLLQKDRSVDKVLHPWNGHLHRGNAPIQYGGHHPTIGAGNTNSLLKSCLKVVWSTILNFQSHRGPQSLWMFMCHCKAVHQNAASVHRSDLLMLTLLDWHQAIVKILAQPKDSWMHLYKPDTNTVVGTIDKWSSIAARSQFWAQSRCCIAGQQASTSDSVFRMGCSLKSKSSNGVKSSNIR